jgi:ABC-type lipoprotein export system ATPase subunit
MDQTDLLKQLQKTYGSDTDKLLHDLAALEKPMTKKKTKHELGSDVVVLDAVSRQYKMGGSTVQALKDVSLTIKAGEIVALTGPSGSGKSTLLHLVAGLDHPTSGTVTVDGTQVHTLKGSRMARYRAETLGFVFQFFYLQPFLSLTTNVKVPTFFTAMTEPERAERAKTFIEAVGLTDRANHLPKELSGGQMQRAAIARAMMNHPKLILADEPTGNLDSSNAEAIMALFEEVRTKYGTTIVVVTHDQRVASKADRIIELKDGQILK